VEGLASTVFNMDIKCILLEDRLTSGERVLQWAGETHLHPPQAVSPRPACTVQQAQANGVQAGSLPDLELVPSKWRCLGPGHLPPTGMLRDPHQGAMQRLMRAVRLGRREVSPRHPQTGRLIDQQVLSITSLFHGRRFR
jgi:hypothetical protein